MFKKRRLSVLGSTGSVGQNALRLVRDHPNQFEIISLSCGSSVDLLADQIQEFKPQAVSVADEVSAAELQKKLKSLSFRPKDVFVGMSGHSECIKKLQPQVVLAAMMGTFGLEATLQSIRQNVEVLGIANKEVLVMAGHIINDELKSSKTTLVPVDSEHSAIFQCLMGNRREDLRKILLTASGGPFRTWKKEDFSKIKLSDALQHPNWKMGQKITVDSATMMNKGLEYIEAIRLFDVRPDQMEVLVHPQSVVHSMVEYKDRSVMAQLGVSDMKIPIALALSYPYRMDVQADSELNFTEMGNLTFEKPDLDKFPCLRLAIEAEAMGDEGSIVLNAANEAVVERFLNEELAFVAISQWIEKALNFFKNSKVQSLEDIVKLDAEVKSWIQAELGLPNKKGVFA